jgi:mannose-6-phosphate isomerase-like protein (cupin superfamily)
MTAANDNRNSIVRLADEEPTLRHPRRQIGILVASDDQTITYAHYGAHEQVAGPHVHHQHTDAFYVLEGELIFEIGSESETITLSSGGFVAVPPGVVHSFRTTGDHPARRLTIHAPDGGFAAFMRGVRDGLGTEWDIAPGLADGGLPASNAIVRPPTPAASVESTFVC